MQGMQQVFGLQAHIICLLVACAGSVRIVFIEQGNASLQFLRCVKEELVDLLNGLILDLQGIQIVLDRL